MRGGLSGHALLCVCSPRVPNCALAPRRAWSTRGPASRAQNHRKIPSSNWSLVPSVVCLLLSALGHFRPVLCSSGQRRAQASVAIRHEGGHVFSAANAHWQRAFMLAGSCSQVYTIDTVFPDVCGHAAVRVATVTGMGNGVQR